MATIEVRLRPRAHWDELIGVVDGVLQARVTDDAALREALAQPNDGLRRL